MRIEMKTSHLLLGLMSMGGVFAVSACQTAPVYVAEPAAAVAEPAAVPQELAERRENGVRVNSLGGEIPSAKPVTPIGNEGMGEAQ